MTTLRRRLAMLIRLVLVLPLAALARRFLVMAEWGAWVSNIVEGTP